MMLFGGNSWQTIATGGLTASTTSAGSIKPLHHLGSASRNYPVVRVALFADGQVNAA
jgi:hypothetical protein